METCFCWHVLLGTPARSASRTVGRTDGRAGRRRFAPPSGFGARLNGFIRRLKSGQFGATMVSPSFFLQVTFHFETFRSTWGRGGIFAAFSVPSSTGDGEALLPSIYPSGRQGPSTEHLSMQDARALGHITCPYKTTGPYPTFTHTGRQCPSIQHASIPHIPQTPRAPRTAQAPQNTRAPCTIPTDHADPTNPP